LTEHYSITQWHFSGSFAIIASEEELMAFYSRLFSLFHREAAVIGHPRRIIGFERLLPEGESERFLGMEISPDHAGSTELSYLFLDDCLMSISNPSGSRKKSIKWLWQANSNGSLIGEFQLSDDPTAIYRISANAYITPDNPSDHDAVLLTDYDPAWPEQYRQMATELQTMLGAQEILRLEHYGSTAIPGLPAKPVIDILMEVSSFDSARPWLLPALNQKNWEYWWYGDHMVFVRRDQNTGIRTHHLHVAPKAHRLWEGLEFRDYLISHPDVAEEYAALKTELAQCFAADREAYTNAKTEFVRRITAQAQNGTPRRIFKTI